MDGIISFEVRKHKIYLPLEDFSEVLDLPFTKPFFKPNEYNYNYEIVASSFLLGPNSRISSPFIIGPLHLEICLTHYVTNHIIFIRKRNFSHLAIFDVVAVWLLSNKIGTNWENAVTQHMLGAKRKDYVCHMVI